MVQCESWDGKGCHRPARWTVVVHVVAPGCVRVLSALVLPFQQRLLYLEAQPTITPFRFGEWRSVEEFVIALQSHFVPSDTVSALVQVVGNIEDGAVRGFGDDGVTQQVTARAGIARKADVPVPNPVILAPYRTFPEVEQPASRFVFRMRSGQEQPQCALFEADGGAWRLAAIAHVARWLREELPGVTVLA